MIIFCHMRDDSFSYARTCSSQARHPLHKTRSLGSVDSLVLVTMTNCPDVRDHIVFENPSN
eukprot:jgi/Botrbrau1/21836/Bobra.0190s0050.1